MPEPISMGAAALIGAGTQIIGSLIGGGARRRAERDAQRKQARLQRKLSSLEASRQAITNPYSGVSNLSSLAVDLSSNLTNPYANLSVATQAAEMQVEQADISLANTLDTIRSTGSGAGGATALAQAALQSKKGVSASIEQQEANNERLRAQGEQQMEQLKMQEGARIQGIQIAEGGRTQGLDAAGKQFMFSTKENREMAQLDRVSAQLAGAQGQAMQASAARQANTAGLIGGLASIGGSYLTGLASQNPYDTTSAGTDTNNTFSNLIGNASSGGNFNFTPSLTESIYGGNTPSVGSDRRLKNNINKIGKSQSGLNIYSFKYIDKSLGEGTWQGVMSDEAPKNAVIKNFLGVYDGVDYSKIDVEFKQI